MRGRWEALMELKIENQHAGWAGWTVRASRKNSKAQKIEPLGIIVSYYLTVKLSFSRLDIGWNYKFCWIMLFFLSRAVAMTFRDPFRMDADMVGLKSVPIQRLIAAEEFSYHVFGQSHFSGCPD